MSDFETHPRGVAMEIKASRHLAEQIEQTIQQWGPGVIPHNIVQAYNKLYEVYIKQMEMEYTG
jgi:hypothetical protein